MKKSNISGWGRHPFIEAELYRNTAFMNKMHDQQEDIDSVIAYGNGRSYGDSALNEQVVDMRNNNYLLGFDEENGVVHCQSGVLLSDLIDVFLPKGWFLGVSPGTKYVTVGGAIASDIHGKNHHVAGAFSNFVHSFRLLLPDGNVVSCSNTEHADLFQATCGGMGLTGIILDAHIQLVSVNSSYIDQKVIKTKNLQETFEAFERYKQYTYSVAWIDCLAKGKALGRSLLILGEHSLDGGIKPLSSPKLTVPMVLPTFTLNKWTIKAFNTLYYHKVRRKETNNTVPIGNYFYPLDVLNGWNKIYGKNGFTQYQFVLPLANSFEGLQEVLQKIAAFGKGSFLSVLKLFGKGNANYLSFPMEGYTLTLDFKIEPGLFDMLEELDKIILKHGGRIYLTKDVRVSKEVFEKGYPMIEEFRALRKKYGMDKMFQSLQSKRLGL